MSKQRKKKVKEQLPELLYVRQEEHYEFDGNETDYIALPQVENFARVGQTVRVGVYSLVGYEDISTNVVVKSPA